MYIHLLRQQLKRKQTQPPVVFIPSQFSGLGCPRRIHPTYLLEFDDGETMEVDQPTKVPVRPERPGGRYVGTVLLGSCWWLLVTMPSWNSKGKRRLLSLTPRTCFFLWKFILGIWFVIRLVGFSYLVRVAKHPFFYWGLSWPGWVDFWEPMEFSLVFMVVSPLKMSQPKSSKFGLLVPQLEIVGNSALELVFWVFPASNHCIKYPWDPM